MRTRRSALALGLLLLVGGAIGSALWQSPPVQRDDASSAPPVAARQHATPRGAPRASPPAETADTSPATRAPEPTKPSVPVEPSASPDTADLRITVVDQHGAARGGVHLVVGWVDHGKVVKHHDADLGPDAQALVRGVQPGRVSVQLVVGGLRRVYPTQTNAGRITDLRCEIPFGATIAGTVRHVEKGPLAGVSVEIRKSPVSRGADGHYDMVRGVTDEAGRYLLTDVPPGDHDIAVTGPALGYNARARDRIHVDGALDLVHDIVVGNVSLAGTVRDAETGRPVAGAAVQFWDRLRLRADTDAAGSYRFVDLPAGVLKGNVAADGFETSVVETPPIETGHTARLDVVLRPAAVLELTITDTAGRPIIGEVILDWSRAGSAVSQGGHLRADDQGVVRVTQLVPDTWQVGVRAVGYERAVQSVTLPREGARLTYVLKGSAPTAPTSSGNDEGPAITGRITDEESKAPLRGVSVVVEAPPKETATDADGRFRVPTGGAAKCTLQVSKDGYGIRFIQLDGVDPVQGRDFDVALQPAATLQLHVTQPDGAAYVGGFVLAFRPIEGGTSFGADVKSFGTNLRTNSEGRATYRQMVPGRYRVRVIVIDVGSSEVEREITPGENSLDVNLR